MHELSHDPRVPERRLDEVEPVAGGLPADAPTPATPTRPEPQTDPDTGTDICALCDIVNDTYVAPRNFVLGWRLAGDGE